MHHHSDDAAGIAHQVEQGLPAIDGVGPALAPQQDGYRQVVGIRPDQGISARSAQDAVDFDEGVCPARRDA
jgi:hypothetical protein